MIVEVPNTIDVFKFLLPYVSRISDQVIVNGSEHGGSAVEAVFITGTRYAIFTGSDACFYFHIAGIIYPAHEKGKRYRIDTLGEFDFKKDRHYELPNLSVPDILEELEKVEPVLAEALLFHLDKLMLT